jgi:SAM-dependent methyltransferase
MLPLVEVNAPDLVAREYATLDRCALRRLDRTGWLRDAGEPVDTVLAALAEVRPRRVLDAGSGDGSIAALVAAPEVVCLDQSQAAVDAACARGLEAVRGDIAALPFADGEFDAVMCNWTLYHLPDLDRGVSELARVLRPGGRMVGAYNMPDHLCELWSAVGRDAGSASFTGETGIRALARHFGAVDRRDTCGAVLWQNREALQAYLDAYVEIAGPLTAPTGPYPFHARRRNCVLVADRTP